MNLEQILAIPATQPARKGIEILRAWQRREITVNDIPTLKADWEWVVCTYTWQGEQKIYHPSFPDLTTVNPPTLTP
jgi:hypothetical protein